MTASPGRDERDMYHYYQGRDEHEDSAERGHDVFTGGVPMASHDGRPALHFELARLRAENRRLREDACAREVGPAWLYESNEMCEGAERELARLREVEARALAYVAHRLDDGDLHVDREARLLADLAAVLTRLRVVEDRALAVGRYWDESPELTDMSLDELTELAVVLDALAAVLARDPVQGAAVSESPGQCDSEEADRG